MRAGAVPDVEALADGVRTGRRAAVARAITLVESTRPDHREAAQRLLGVLLPSAGGARRVGVSGVPGVGKSTFVDALGTRLTAAGSRVAVLAVDPSSARTGGSILGDRTRMARLASDPAAFVRPSPARGTLGGVAAATREAVVVVEAAGYDVVLVETVGVGQSETAVADLVDVFLLLTLARSGDSLQGIKKGVLELADVVAVTKADGAGAEPARAAAAELRGALRLLRGTDEGGRGVPVLTCSAVQGSGLDEVWAAVVVLADARAADGGLAARRAEQAVRWTWALVEDAVLDRLRSSAAVRDAAPEVEAAVRGGRLPPSAGAARLLEALHRGGQSTDGPSPGRRAGPDRGDAAG